MAAVKTDDPRLSTEAYLERHQLNELLEGLLAELLIHKPADPKHYVISQLEKIKVAGTKPLLDTQDLSAMFTMFDITKRGTVTEQQASHALRTVLGSKAPKPSSSSSDGAAVAALGQQEFVSFMTTALQAAAPRCRSTISNATAR